MGFNTLTVGAAVTPSVIGTAISHYVNRKPLHGKPTAHISYDEGLHLVRQFLEYASNHTVDEIQAFTAQWVPSPRWVKLDEISIPESYLSKAATYIETQLGPRGIDKVGGTKWWQWRPSSTPLKAEWIEMRAHYNARKTLGTKAQRLMLYIHGGAYYFGSVDEHRYQLQRHARKLRARLLAPRYRLSPQFPFPCGLQDALASYLLMLDEYDPKTIILAGDSAGGGMTLSLLVLLRDQGLPLPAGAILLSPWVDLTHSFPSVAGDGKLDYIPAYGFHHRPSMTWPPPNDEDMRKLRAQVGEPQKKSKSEVPGARVSGAGEQVAQTRRSSTSSKSTIPPNHNLALEMDGKHVELLDQIQMYAPNWLINHPLVSPVMQPSLGGLPPILIQTGGGELLRDEQIYIAHKLAQPQKYAPAESVLDEYDPARKILNAHPPTMVQLQVWEDLCHVPQTLSFTRPAKHMYRAVAQFGDWCYRYASRDPTTGIESSAKSTEDDALSVISTSTSSSSDTAAEESPPDPHQEKLRSQSDGAIDPGTPSSTAQLAVPKQTRNRSQSLQSRGPPLATVSATEPLPPFEHSMIRQQVTRYGTIYPLPPISDLPALHLDPAQIGVPKPGPVRKWLAKQATWDKKFATAKRKVQNRRLEEMRLGYVVWEGERPPPTALAGRRVKGGKEEMTNLGQASGRKKRSLGLAMWSGWGSKHDETTVEHGESRPAAGDRERRVADRHGQKRSRSVGSALRAPLSMLSLSRSRKAKGGATATLGKEEERSEESGRTGVPSVAVDGSGADTDHTQAQTEALAAALPDAEKVKGSENTFLAPEGGRPHNGTVAYPFKVRPNEGLHERSASTMTLDSGMNQEGIVSEGGAARGVTAADVPTRVDGAGDGALASGTKGKSVPEAKEQRPKLETFVTAAEF